jgi:nucleoside-diphosphate-sugar epimerase
LRHIAELAGGMQPAEHLPARAGDVRDSLADIGAARELIGYTPSVDIREGLKRTFASFAARERAAR